MATNILATIIVCVVTNWTDQYEAPYYPPAPIPTWPWTNNWTVVPCGVGEWGWWDRGKNALVPRKLTGREGKVVETTVISFDYQGPREMQIERTLATISQRCREKPPKPVELEWDEPVITPYNYLDGMITTNDPLVEAMWQTVRDIRTLREQVEKGGGR